MDSLEVGVVNVDYYYQDIHEILLERCDISNCKTVKMPIIRIFGSNTHGQRTCLHVHGFFPYLYFRPEALDDCSFQSEEQVDRYLPGFQRKINQALASNRSKNTACDIVHRIKTVSRMTLYGYWPRPLLFVQVWLYAPEYVRRLAALLEDGLLGAPMLCYEAHIPYLLQCTSDLSLTPMGYCKVGDFKLRPPVSPPPAAARQGEETRGSQSSDPSSGDVSGADHLWRPQSSLPAPVSTAKPAALPESDAESAAVNKSSGSELDLASLFEGLGSQDFRWTPSQSQSQSQSQQQSQESNPAPGLNSELVDYPYQYHTDLGLEHKEEVRLRFIPQRVTVCAVEADALASSLDQRLLSPTSASQQQRDGFGAELWAEEALRCELEGLPAPEPVPVGPCSGARHWPVFQSDRDMLTRLRRLQLKGEALAGIAAVADAGDINATPHTGETSSSPSREDVMSTSPPLLLHGGGSAGSSGGKVNPTAKWSIGLAAAAPQEWLAAQSPLLSLLSPMPEPELSVWLAQQRAAEASSAADCKHAAQRLSQDSQEALLPLPVAVSSPVPDSGRRRRVSFASPVGAGSGSDESDSEGEAEAEAAAILRSTQPDYDECAVMVEERVHSSRRDLGPQLAAVEQLEAPSVPAKRERPLTQSVLSSGAARTNRVRFSDELPSPTFEPRIMMDKNSPQVYFLRSSLPAPPSSAQLLAGLNNLSLLHTVHQSPYFGLRSDCPSGSRTVTVAGARLVLRTADSVAAFPSADEGPCLSLYSPAHADACAILLRTEALHRDAAAAEKVKAAAAPEVLIYDVDEDSYDILPVGTSAIDGAHGNSNGNANVKILQGERLLLRPSFLAPRLSASSAAAPALPLAQSQVGTPTQTNDKQWNLRLSAAPGGPRRASRKSYLSVCSMELFCCSRIAEGEAAPRWLAPDARFDPISLIAYELQETEADADSETVSRCCGLVTSSQYNGDDSEWTAVQSRGLRFLRALGLAPGSELHVERSERDLLLRFLRIVRTADPDLLCGYEAQAGSFGYLLARGRMQDIDVAQLLGRTPGLPASVKHYYGSAGNNNNNNYEAEHESALLVTGRPLLNVWKLLAGELKLTDYSAQGTALYLLQRREPRFSPGQLTRWYRDPRQHRRTVLHTLRLARLSLELLHALDLLRRTAESARLYGIDFHSVLTRGSQYRVEANLIRTAHSQGYIALSPSRRRVAGQAAMAVIPLVMEPRSGLYPDPVIVLDFQSLYPSMICAYNLCFSTILGRLQPGAAGTIDTGGRLGAVQYPERVTAELLHSIGLSHSGTDAEENEGQREYEGSCGVFLAPNGSLFCTRDVREGLLPRMLREVLETRFMVKRAMRRAETQEGRDVLRRVLDARQLSVKLLANVTYGYASAGYSGRMPMAELADAVVQCGRSTLEWAAGFIGGHSDWRANVVYGDTDSLFVQVRGRSRAQAAALGAEMAAEVSARCPAGVELKFEKVYHPCVLASKKRYAGRAFDTIAAASDPLHGGRFDAKGVEAVRRDQCPLVLKLQEKSLRLLFASSDLSTLKAYLQEQWNRAQAGCSGGDACVADYVFAKEVRLGHYRGQPPPGAEVAAQIAARDPGSRPAYNWRVPYVVVCGPSRARLVDLAVTPEQLLRRGGGLRLNLPYYMGKCVLPALERVVGLAGADVRGWYAELRRIRLTVRHIRYEDDHGDGFSGRQQPKHRVDSAPRFRQASMDMYTLRGHCICCSAESVGTLCTLCSRGDRETRLALQTRLNLLQRRELALSRQCLGCSGVPQPVQLFTKDALLGSECCESLACPVFHTRWRLVLRTEDLVQATTEL